MNIILRSMQESFFTCQRCTFLGHGVSSICLWKKKYVQYLQLWKCAWSSGCQHWAGNTAINITYAKLQSWLRKQTIKTNSIHKWQARYTQSTHISTVVKHFMVQGPLFHTFGLWTCRGRLLWELFLSLLILDYLLAFIHLSPRLILLVFFGLATWSFGFDMASSISKEGTAHIPLWLLG